LCQKFLKKNRPNPESPSISAVAGDCVKDDHGAGVDSGRVCILGRSRSWSHYFGFEPESESTLRSVQEPIIIFKQPNFCDDACCQTEWN